uniref:Uncharacterized protein n=1 Tax=Anguilla anguilla TaxID=7936 RepID=A0A0E9PLJ6_ANGAN
MIIFYWKLLFNVLVLLTYMVVDISE